MSAEDRSNESRTRKRLRFPLQFFLVSWLLFTLLAVLGMYFHERFAPTYIGTTIFEHRRDVAAEGILERGSESFEAIRLSMQNDLASRNAVVEVAEELGLLEGLSRDSEYILTRSGEMAKQQIVKDIMKDIKIALQTRLPNMDRISVSVTHHDPKLAEQIPNVLVKNYKNRLLGGIKDRLMKSSQFLINQVNRCESRLAEITNEKIRFETKHAGMMPESPGALYEHLQIIDDNLAFFDKQQKADGLKIVRLKAQLTALGKPTATTAPTSRPAGRPMELIQELNPEKARLEEQLRQFKEQLNVALTISHLTDKHPTVRTLRAKIVELEKRLEREQEWITVRKTVGTIDNSIDRRLVAQMLLADIAASVSELEAAAKEKERLLKRREALQSLMSNFAPVRQEYEQIVEKQKKQIVERDLWRRKLAEVQMALDAEMKGRRTHLNVLQVAQAERQRPALLGVLGFAFGGGLILSGVLSLIIMFMRCWTMMTIVCLLLLAGITAATLLLMLSGNGSEQFNGPAGIFP